MATELWLLLSCEWTEAVEEGGESYQLALLLKCSYYYSQPLFLPIVCFFIFLFLHRNCILHFCCCLSFKNNIKTVDWEKKKKKLNQRKQKRRRWGQQTCVFKAIDWTNPDRWSEGIALILAAASRQNSRWHLYLLTYYFYLTLLCSLTRCISLLQSQTKRFNSSLKKKKKKKSALQFSLLSVLLTVMLYRGSSADKESRGRYRERGCAGGQVSQTASVWDLLSAGTDGTEAGWRGRGRGRRWNCAGELHFGLR